MNIVHDSFVGKSPGIFDTFEREGGMRSKFGVYPGYAQIAQQMVVERRGGLNCELEQLDRGHHGMVLLDGNMGGRWHIQMEWRLKLPFICG